MKEVYFIAKHNPGTEAIIVAINNYANAGEFRYAYEYLNIATMFNRDIAPVYYNTLSKYLTCGDRKPVTKDPLLITWTIRPKNVPFLNMVDPDKRLYENMLGLAAWILDRSFENIIVTESSNFEINVEKLKSIGKQFNKNIDYHTFANSENVSKYGKGYGEGEIVKHTFESNELFRKCKRFTKMNGKQYVPFYEFFLLRGQETFEYFNLHYIANKLAVDTRFYCIDKQYYLDRLLDAYTECNDHKDNYLEHVFFEKTQERMNYYLPREPNVLGRQGSIEKNYGDYPTEVHELCKYLIQEIV